MFPVDPTLEKERMSALRGNKEIAISGKQKEGQS